MWAQLSIQEQQHAATHGQSTLDSRWLPTFLLQEFEKER